MEPHQAWAGSSNIFHPKGRLRSKTQTLRAAWVAECELGRVQVERSVPITEHPPSGALIRPDPTLVTLRPALHTLRPALHTLEPLSAVERVSGDRSAK